ncbi:MAG: GntR family transcriptional regulator [Thermodesulfovibrionales bacterium]|nr:GntR family transcriptional regulator [Thermodesulfovibrionales bacterium]
MEELIRRENYQKLYVQLCEIMKRKIENKEWDVGFQIPTEEELCKIYGVSRATVRTAISELVREGYLTRQQGKGTFVKKQMSDELIMSTSFRELMLEQGISFSTEVLAHTTMMPMDNLITLLDCPADKHVIYIKRTTIVEGRPIMVQEIYIPFHICPPLLEEDIVNNSLFGLFKKHKVDITRIRNYFGITYLSPEEAQVFSLAEGSSTLLLNQLFFSGETPVMYTRSIKRSDSFGFSIEFKKSSINERRYYVKR